MPRSPRRTSPAGSRQSSSSSLTAGMGELVLRPVPRASRSRSLPRPRSGEVVVVEEEHNLEVMLHILTLNGKTFVPRDGGAICYNPNNEDHVKKVEKKMKENYEKCVRLGITYETVKLKATIACPLQKVGGIHRGFAPNKFPPKKKYE